MCPPVRRADTQVGPYTPRLCGAISESGFTQKPEESNFHMQCCTDWYMNYSAVKTLTHRAAPKIASR